MTSYIDYDITYDIICDIIYDIICDTQFISQTYVIYILFPGGPLMIDLNLSSVRQQASVPMLYYTASNQHLPCIYICLILPGSQYTGTSPPHPCFINGNPQPTIPYKFKNSRLLQVFTASADTKKNCENSSRLYKVNLWLWRY
jgi:hypothetical protein